MNITIKKIAELADVSRGTVDRVIHDRPGVRDDVRERVSNILKTLDYKPNIAGKVLVNSNKTIKIGVVLSPDYNPFIDEVKRGVLDEAQRIGQYGVELDIEVVNTYKEDEQYEILNKLQALEVAAIAVVPVEKEIIRKKLNELIDSGIPVVTFNSDIAGSKRLCFVGQDNYKAGRTVCGLASMILCNKKKIGIITSSMNLTCHQRRLGGFRDKVRELEGFDIVAIEDNADKSDRAYEITTEYLREYPDIGMIYITGGGVSGVGKAVKDLGFDGKVKIICHDLIPQSIELLKSGTVNMVIGQDPYRQGSLPIKILFDHIFMREDPQRDVYHTGIEIFTAENLIY